MKFVLWISVSLYLLLSSADRVTSHRHHRDETEHGTGHHRCHHKEFGPHRNAYGGGAPIGDTSESQVVEGKPKLLNVGYMDFNRYRTQPDKLIVFNVERYGNWSDWSECIAKECVEVRHRKCLDDSWKRQISNRIQTKRCLSKYYAEKRTCSDKTLCAKPIVLENCGVRPTMPKIVRKIVGGKPADPNSWPWAVRVSYKSQRQKPTTFCGGTLITPQWVITAAHCLLVEEKRLPVGRLIQLDDYMSGKIYVHLGDHHRNDKEETQQDFQVIKAILHPRYHQKLTADGEDIALIYLSKPAKITTEVNYACLPEKDMQLEPGTKCYAVGWGDSRLESSPIYTNIQSLINSLLRPFPSFFGYPGPFGRPGFYRPFGRPRRDREVTTLELHEVELPIVSIDQCSKHYAGLNEDLNICAGARGKDTCSGDSGGGLYCQFPNSDKWYIAGVTSFGLARGCGRNPGVYTSAIAHLDWISSVISE
ncbi:hypothetical protein EG68_08078 [Paragonimus skrjabini miyazakii]|uniref:Peptidase S1 domain-containing protein n=1 Tax=Paragonimus skrjabini miyazakii TaxID=59628 RepID=A0A8S9YD49_9TREM|nr:hypothetical protein EG68_08078 [Paragonimus skrjabini miyazakii]